MDAQGFPLDESYLREQGLSLVDLNREFVTQQEQLQSLQEVLADPKQRAEFLAALDGNNNQVNDPNDQEPVQRQAFPGGAPGQQQQPATLEQYYQQMQDATAAGFPVDNLNASYQMWDSIPDEAWRQLAGTLIKGAF